jgi:hypothetical protein
MSTKKTLETLYPNRIMEPVTVQDIPRGAYLVYILTYNDTPIVVGHGKHNRAKVIFDDKNQITSGHIKAIFVRAYRLFGQGEFKQFLITCHNKDEAKEIEATLHREIGGNSRNLPEDILTSLFKDISTDSTAYMVLRIALSSSFDGLFDLKLWRKDGILRDELWDIVGRRLQFDDPRNKQ